MSRLNAKLKEMESQGFDRDLYLANLIGDFERQIFTLRQENGELLSLKEVIRLDAEEQSRRMKADHDRTVTQLKNELLMRSYHANNSTCMSCGGQTGPSAGPSQTMDTSADRDYPGFSNNSTTNGLGGLGGLGGINLFAPSRSGAGVQMDSATRERLRRREEMEKHFHDQLSLMEKPKIKKTT